MKNRVKNHYPYTGKLDKIIIRLTDKDEYESPKEAAVIESN